MIDVSEVVDNLSDAIIAYRRSHPTAQSIELRVPAAVFLESRAVGLDLVSALDELSVAAGFESCKLTVVQKVD